MNIFFIHLVWWAISKLYQVTEGCLALGATPRDISLIYALPQNSPQDCFDLRVPDGATAVKDYDGGNLYGTSVANLNGGPSGTRTPDQPVMSRLL